MGLGQVRLFLLSHCQSLLVKVEEHSILFWDEKGRQRDGNIKGSMSPAGAEPAGTRASSKLCLGLTTRGNLGLFLLIIFHFPIDFHEFRVDFIRKGFMKVSWNLGEFAFPPGGWIQSGWLCCEQLSVRKHQLTSSTEVLKLLLNCPSPLSLKRCIYNKIME